MERAHEAPVALGFVGADRHQRCIPYTLGDCKRWPSARHRSPRPSGYQQPQFDSVTEYMHSIQRENQAVGCGSLALVPGQSQDLGLPQTLTIAERAWQATTGRLQRASCNADAKSLKEGLSPSSPSSAPPGIKLLASATDVHMQCMLHQGNLHGATTEVTRDSDGRFVARDFPEPVSGSIGRPRIMSQEAANAGTGKDCKMGDGENKPAAKTAGLDADVASCGSRVDKSESNLRPEAGARAAVFGGVVIASATATAV
ncbi:hypothetical protein BT67DRAFT_433501 [Trichocladium antarcticum]|uniref:Uncharacterized protein n=1 Tax=Trichocladium antarcticum TaxID=1450529 RepID=A0AAN6UMB8_9PEZI|nr:hypothetical protein BT67DRAFT_433501 [Trichocladium antarcticum]